MHKVQNVYAFSPSGQGCEKQYVKMTDDLLIFLSLLIKKTWPHMENIQLMWETKSQTLRFWREKSEKLNQVSRKQL